MVFPDGTGKEGYFDNNVFKGDSLEKRNTKLGNFATIGRFEANAPVNQSSLRAPPPKQMQTIAGHRPHRGSKVSLEGFPTPGRGRNGSVPLSTKWQTRHSQRRFI